MKKLARVEVIFSEASKGLHAARFWYEPKIAPEAKECEKTVLIQAPTQLRRNNSTCSKENFSDFELPTENTEADLTAEIALQLKQMNGNWPNPERSVS